MNMIMISNVEWYNRWRCWTHGEGITHNSMDITGFVQWKRARQRKKRNKEWDESWTANNIGDEGAAKISESLMTNTTLTELILYDDNIIKNKQE